MSAWTILFVDDELEVLSALRRELETTLCRVLTCTDPRAALDLVAREQVDVLVADLQMPGMSGIELLTAARARFPSVARIVVTGSSSTKSAVEAINSGKVLRYIQKPWARDEVRAAITEAIHWVDRERRAEEQILADQAREAVRDELTATWPNLLDAVVVDGARVIDVERCRAVARRLEAPALLAALPEALPSSNASTTSES